MITKDKLTSLVDKNLLTFYITSLATLIAIPLYVMYNSSSVFAYESAASPIVWLIGFIAAIILARKLGKRVSRNTNYDSILLFRYALLLFFLIITTVDYWLYFFVVNEEFKAFSLTTIIIDTIIVALNILGIYIHHKKRGQVIKNVRKEELFQ